MSRLKSYTRIVALQRLQQTLAEAELRQAHAAVTDVERGLSQCCQQDGQILSESQRALGASDKEEWLACQLSREVLCLRSMLLDRELAGKRQAEAAKREAYADAQMRCEQTTMLLEQQRELVRVDAAKHAQKIADEFALQKFARRS